jgi:hypothetical protein
MNAIKFILNMSRACCNDGDMQTTQDHALLLVLVKTGSLPSPNLLSKYEWELLPHAPYIPDMSPSDFDLFHKLKQPMRGQRFPSLEEVSAAVIRAIRGLKKCGTLNGIENLPKRWGAVTEKQGDYIEGL